jgi:hypothetical protein
MEKYRVRELERRPGIQKIYRFPNNRGASIICTQYSYGGDKGLWELAVIKFNKDDWKIDYDTPITEDVIGHNTWKEIEELLKQIKEL